MTVSDFYTSNQGGIGSRTYFYVRDDMGEHLYHGRDFFGWYTSNMQYTRNILIWEVYKDTEQGDIWFMLTLESEV